MNDDTEALRSRLVLLLLTPTIDPLAEDPSIATMQADELRQVIACVEAATVATLRQLGGRGVH